MAGFNTHIYAIGKPKSGIVIVTFDPDRVFKVSWESIEEYAKTRMGGADPNTAYRDLCARVTGLVADLSDGHLKQSIDTYGTAFLDLAERKAGINDGDLCISALIDLSLHTKEETGPTLRRSFYEMFHGVLDQLEEGGTRAQHTPYDPGDDGHGH